MFERGFKAWSERLAEQYRREMGCAPMDPLSPWNLAKFLEIKLWYPGDVPGLDSGVLRRLTGESSDAWSAVTLCCDGSDLIILNSGHAKTRQANDLMHEIAHLICGHAAARVDVTVDGLLMLNTYDKNQEEEADWLAGALLLPRVALLSIANGGWDWDDAARQYGVSRRLFDWRMNASGVIVQYQRTAARRLS